jgi:VWFA-related protein
MLSLRCRPVRVRAMASRIIGTVPLCFVFLGTWLVAFQERPLFKSWIAHVSIDVAVVDSRGRPITDLTPTDFRILESGRPQTITSFRFVSIASHPTPILTHSVFTEHIAGNIPVSPDSRLFALIVDDLHLTEMNVSSVKRVMTDFIERLSAGDEASIVFVGRSDLGIGITNDRTRLTSAAGRVRDALGFGLDAEPGGIVTGPGGGSVPKREAYSYARAASYTLKNVMKALTSSRHARRAIVYISGGTTLDPLAPLARKEHADATAFFTELRDLFGVALNHGIPIYTLDPRGLVGPDNAIRSPALLQTSTFRSEVVRRINIQQDYLRTLAEGTGGRAFVQQGDLTAAVTQVLNANGSFYVIGYSSDAPAGSQHRLEISVARPGTKVTTRRQVSTSALHEASKRPGDLLDRALESALDVGSIPMRVSVVPLSVQDKKRQTVVTIQVVYPVASDPPKIDDTIHLGILALDVNGKLKAQSRRSFVLKATPRRPGDVTFLLNAVIEVPPIPLIFRVGVLSEGLQRAGAVALESDLSARHALIELSPLLIGFAGPSREPALAPETIKDIVSWQPTTTRAFDRADSIRVMSTISGKQAETAAFNLTIRRNSPDATRSLLTVPMTLRRVDTTSAVAEAQVSLSSLEPGAYLLEASAKDSSGHAVASRIVLFTVK